MITNILKSNLIPIRSIFRYDARMQNITSLSKFLFLVLLSGSLILVWNGSNTNAIIMGYTSTAESLTARQNNSIWNTLGSEFKLDHQAQSARVKTEIRKLLADQDKLYQILKAAAPYIYFIHQQTELRGLPAEIALIPVIESEFNPNDRSNKGATGLWQLMPGTASELGVKVRSGYDGRRNVIDSTKAALAYFNDLGNNFNGDWYLAIAAYNSGQGRVQSAVRRAGTNSFWNLPLPLETKLYVPKLLAVAAIVKDPQKYGVQLPPISNEPYFAEVKTTKPVSLTKVAESSGVNIKTLTKLNPDYKNSGAVQKKGMYSMLVPVNSVPVVKSQISKS